MPEGTAGKPETLTGKPTTRHNTHDSATPYKGVMARQQPERASRNKGRAGGGGVNIAEHWKRLMSGLSRVSGQANTKKGRGTMTWARTGRNRRQGSNVSGQADSADGGHVEKTSECPNRVHGVTVWCGLQNQLSDNDPQPVTSLQDSERNRVWSGRPAACVPKACIPKTNSLAQTRRIACLAQTQRRPSLI